MSNQLELDWLTEERPAPLPLDPGATARARAELLSYAAAGGASRPQRRLLRGHTLRIAVSGAALAAVGGAVLLGTQVIGTRSGSGLGVLSVQNASARQLTRLSAKVASAPAPAGDATLVLHTQTNDTGTSTGAELFTDAGNDYYAPTAAGLPATIRAGETVNLGGSDQETRDIAAAKAALTEPIGTALQQMSVADLDPDATPQTPGATAAQKAALATQKAVIKEKLAAMSPQARAKAEAEAQDTHFLISSKDDMVWNNAMDAVLADPEDAQVRAGVLELLSTIQQITVTQGTLDGQPTLILTANIYQQGSNTYQEQWILNADTGIPVEFIGGNQGQPPSATVDYTISRVTVGAIESGDTTTTATGTTTSAG